MLIKKILYIIAFVSSLCFGALTYAAVDSGSTGSDGDLAPTSDITVSLPADGILNYSSINIPAGVTLRFIRNSLNTPAFVLVSGDAVIDGIVDLSGVTGGDLSVSHPPGGFAGGIGQGRTIRGGNGKGPGGAEGGSSATWGAAGAGYRLVGEANIVGIPGSAYGSTALQPLIGGSGGGAVTSNQRLLGFNGGNGGGALLLAVSGTLTLNGSILARGGDGESVPEDNTADSAAGGGSGGGIRLVATTFLGSGIIDVSGGNGGAASSGHSNSPRANGSEGSLGRVRIEVELLTFTGQIIPASGTIPVLPQPIFLANLPTIRISSVAGNSVPVNPSGFSDVILPSTLTDPVTVEFEATGVPPDTTVLLTLTPETGSIVEVVSLGLTGTDLLTASVDVTLAQGASTMLASLAFSVSATQSQSLSQFTQGEPVKRVELSSTMSKGSEVVLITETGRSVTISSSAANFTAH